MQVCASASFPLEFCLRDAPSLVLSVPQMTLSDGKIKTFELPIEQFHRLRFGVAKMLREMQQLERHPIMRLAFDREKASRD